MPGTLPLKRKPRGALVRGCESLGTPTESLPDPALAELCNVLPLRPHPALNWFPFLKLTLLSPASGHGLHMDTVDCTGLWNMG